MKRTLKGIAAAYVVLGAMAPAAFASTPSLAWEKTNIQFAKYTANGVSGYVENNTTYMPIWYVLQALKQSGYDYTYDGKVLNIKTPSGVTPDTSNIELGFGNLTIQINGTDVKKVITEVHKDPAGGKHAVDTTYIPIYYIQQILRAVHFHNTWDGTNWKGTQLSSVSVSAANSSVSVGQGDKLTIVVKDSDGNTVTPDTVSYSVTDSSGNPTDGAAVSQNGVFVASQPGNYVVTVTAEGVVGRVNIAVYGQAVALQVKPESSSVVADGAAKDAITITAVDSNGNVVGNYSGTVSVSVTSGATIVTSSGTPTSTVTLKNGSGTVYVQAPYTSAGNSGTITATASGLTFATATVTYEKPTATALQVTPESSFLSASGTNTDAVTITVLDQAGNPMPSAVTDGYSATVTLTGPATFTDGTKGPENVYFSAAYPGVVYVQDAVGQSGTITVTATGEGLKQGSATITEGVPGSATTVKLALPSSVQNATITADQAAASGLAISGTVLDTNGFTTVYNGTLTYTVTMGGQTVASSSIPVSGSSFSIPIDNHEQKAGTYTVTVTGSGLTQQSLTFTVTPGSATQLVVSPISAETVTVPVGNPTTTITAKVEDSEGNVVATAGQQVNFYVDTALSSSGVLLNNNPNATSSGTPVTVYTDDTGTASLTVTLPTGAGKTAVVDAYLGAVTGSPSSVVRAGTITETGAVASKVVVSASSSSLTAGTTATVSVLPEDSFGDLVSGDTVILTIPSGLFSGAPNITGGTRVTNPALASNQYEYVVGASGLTITGTVAKAGTYTITAQDVSTSAHPSGSASLSVAPGALNGFHVFDTNGNDLSLAGTGDTIAANGGSLQVVIMPVDGFGNVVKSDATYNLNLALPSGTSLDYRMTPSGAINPALQIKSGQTSETLYLVNDGGSPVTVGASGSVLTVSATGVSGSVAVAASAPSPYTATVSGSTVTLTGPVSSGSFSKSESYTLTFTLTSGSTPLANEHVLLSASGSAVLSSTSTVTNAQGQVTVTLTVPSGTPSPGTTTITVTDGSLSTTPLGSFTVTY